MGKLSPVAFALPICMGIIAIMVIYQVGYQLKALGDQDYDIADIYQQDATFHRDLLPYLRDKKLRPAEDMEVKAWVDRYRVLKTQEVPSLHISNVYNQTHFDLMRNGVFIVEGPIHLPEGMVGNKKRQFIVPFGVPVPSYTDLGDAQIYLMDGASCLGAGGTCHFEALIEEAKY